MPGEPLMCVWQAVLAKDVFPESGVKRSCVLNVVENFAGINNIVYSERRFKEIFTDEKVRLLNVLHFLLVSRNTPAFCFGGKGFLWVLTLVYSDGAVGGFDLPPPQVIILPPSSENLF